MSEDIAQKVKQIIVNKLGVEESQVTDTASFTNDLGADSLDTVQRSLHRASLVQSERMCQV